MPKGSHANVAKEIGATSEAVVLARLIELGFAVSVPFGGHLRYDLVVDDGHTLTRAQVKTGRLRGGNRIVFPAASRQRSSSERRTYIGQADDFLVYCPETNEIYRIAVADCGSRAHAYLWVAEPRRRTGRPEMHWARDHIFTGDARLEQLEPLATCAVLHPDKPSRMTEKSTTGRRYCKECNLVYCRKGRTKTTEGAAA